MKPKILIILSIIFTALTLGLALISSFVLENELSWFVICGPLLFFAIVIFLPQIIISHARGEEKKRKDNENKQ